MTFYSKVDDIACQTLYLIPRNRWQAVLLACFQENNEARILVFGGQHGAYELKAEDSACRSKIGKV